MPAQADSRVMGQNEGVIDPRFVFLAALLSLVGAYGYIRDTLRGSTAPHRVTWSLWALEGILGFIVEVQQHVGLAAVMTLMLGLVPLIVVAASFRHRHYAWQIDRFDAYCGAISLLGLASWALIHQATVGLIAFVGADQLAAIPTLRKAWGAPATESSPIFFLGVLNTAITLLTLDRVTTAGALFPGAILITDLLLGLLIVTRAGPRARRELQWATEPRVAP